MLKATIFRVHGVECRNHHGVGGRLREMIGRRVRPERLTIGGRIGGHEKVARSQARGG